MSSELTYEQVSELLHYEPETGKLFWKERHADLFDAPWLARRWNTKWAGKEAFASDDGNGYRQGRIFNKKYRAHRVCWLLHYREWPSQHIDHLNGDRADNSIDNMRDAPQSENLKNSARRSDNTSGTTGVSYQAASKRWVARITISGIFKSLGHFTTLEEAVAARKAADVLYGFSARHGT